MRIAIDARFFGEAGPGRYTKNIITHLEKIDTTNEYLIFMQKRNIDSYVPHNPNFKKILADFKWYSFEEQIFFLAQLMLFAPNLLYVPHFNVPVLYPGKLVSAIPDIIMHTFSTEAGTTLPKPYYKFKKFVYYIVVLLAVLKSKKVIVASKATLSDFRKVYPFISEKKYLVCYEGVDPDLKRLSDQIENSSEYKETSAKVLEKYGVKKPYLLYVSSMYKHKNVEKLVDAFEILKTKFQFKGQLVIVGKKDYFSRAVKSHIEYKNLSEFILMPGESGYVPDEDVTYLRKNAELYVFPSLKEGFSLTPLEAMSCGLPCAISDIECHKEIFGDSCEFFDPSDPENIAEVINSLVKDPERKKKLVEEGYKIIQKYRWEDSAQITSDVINS
jgi:glycosyltransferase involved in cell wall biosynthesis